MLEGYNGDPHLSSILDFFLNKILGGSDSRASAYNVGDPGLIPGLGRSPGEGNVNPLQYSCLRNPMERGPGRQESMGLQRVRHACTTNFHFHFFQGRKPATTYL